METESNSNPASGPLVGLRVVEFGSTVAGPFCARLLADFGADVIKIEQPEGDTIRSMGTQHDGQSLYAASILRNKRLISLNLRDEAGRELARDLCRKADIVVENFRPGTMKRWGLGYDELSQENPGLIFVQISGFGQDGPYSTRGGYGVVCEAVSGMREITGDPDRPPPRVATSITDYIAGLYAAFGAVMAVVERHRTGRGQIVDSALYEGAFSFMEPHIPAFQQAGKVAERAGPRLPGSTPNSLYETGDGRQIVITAAAEAVFARLANAIGKPHLADDPRFSSNLARVENEDACDAEISEWTRTKTTAEIEAIMVDAKVPAARIYTVADIFDDPHYRAREMLLDVDDADLGAVTVTGIVPKLSQTPGAVWRAGPRIGEDTLAVLRDELALTEQQIQGLQQSGIVAGLSPNAEI